MSTDNHKILIQQITDLIKKGNAHATLDDALEGIPFELLSKKPAGLPYSIWQLAEHIRITQKDILDFSRNDDYKELKWPEEYWPKETAPQDEQAWENCKKAIYNDRAAFIQLVQTSGDIYTPFTHGDGQNLLREALLLADHNSYHAGELIVLRRLLGAWK